MADLQDPFKGDSNLPDGRISNLDRLYLGISTALDKRLEAIDLEVAIQATNEILAPGFLLPA